MSKEMDCSEVKNLIPRYLAGELDEETRRRVEEHLRDCPSCRQDADLDDELGRVLGESVSDDPPEDYWDDYNDKLRSRIRGAVAMSWRMGCLPGCLAGAIGGLLGAFLIENGLRTVQTASGPTGWLRELALIGVIALVIGLGIRWIITRANRSVPVRYTRDETSLKHAIARSPLYRWTFVSLFMLAHLGVSVYVPLAFTHDMFMPGWAVWPLRALLFVGFASIIPACYRSITGYLDGRDVHAEWARKSIRERLTAHPLMTITALFMLAIAIWDHGMLTYVRAPSECSDRAEVLFSSGDTQSAVSMLKSCIRDYGDRYEVLDCYRQLAEMYENTGRPAEARDTYRAGTRAYEYLIAHPKFYHRKQDRLWMLGDAADLYIELGDNKSAFEVSTVRLQMDPDDADNIYFVASDYARAGYKAEAKALYTRMTLEFPNSMWAESAKENLRALY